jgi:hypothetical protein
MPVYVETCIRGPVEEVWRLTQTPELHERWDLRFTTITYLPSAGDGEPQRFRYATRLGAGVEIAGWGETVGERLAGGARTSALRFGSDDRRSLIRAGSGYWKYEPIGDGSGGDGSPGESIRFVTGYDYEVRWGALGRIADRLVFRPLMGWATAWSFDRLRLWIERGVEPAGAARRALVHALAASAVAFVWLWHGVVPKLLGPHPDELAMLTEAGVAEPWATWLTLAAGVAETLFGLAFLPLSRRRWPWLLTIALMAAATVGVVATSPHRALAAFGPVSLDLAVAALAAIGLLSLADLPSARRCRRRPP